MDPEREASDADAAEQRDLEESADDAVDVPSDATEADVLDQHRPARADATGRDEPREIPAEVPEADALDQSRSVPDEDDDLRDD